MGAFLESINESIETWFRANCIPSHNHLTHSIAFVRDTKPQYWVLKFTVERGGQYAIAWVECFSNYGFEDQVTKHQFQCQTDQISESIDARTSDEIKDKIILFFKTNIDSLSRQLAPNIRRPEQASGGPQRDSEPDNPAVGSGPIEPDDRGARVVESAESPVKTFMLQIKKTFPQPTDPRVTVLIKDPVYEQSLSGSNVWKMLFTIKINDTIEQLDCADLLSYGPELNPVIGNVWFIKTDPPTPNLVLTDREDDLMADILEKIGDAINLKLLSVLAILNAAPPSDDIRGARDHEGCRITPGPEAPCAQLNCGHKMCEQRQLWLTLNRLVSHLHQRMLA